MAPLSSLPLMIGPLGMQEMLIILVVALIVFGPRKLPQIGKTLGKSIAEFRRTSTELRSTLEREVQMEEFRAARTEVADLKKDVTNLGRGLDPGDGVAPDAGGRPDNSPVGKNPGPDPVSSGPEPESAAGEPALTAAETDVAAGSPGGNGAASGDGAAESESRGDSGE